MDGCVDHLSAKKDTEMHTHIHLYNGFALDTGGSVQVLEMSRFSDCWRRLASPIPAAGLLKKGSISHWPLATSPIPSPISIRTAGEGWTARSLQLSLGLFSRSPLGGRSPDYSDYADSDYSD